MYMDSSLDNKGVFTCEIHLYMGTICGHFWAIVSTFHLVITMLSQASVQPNVCRGSFGYTVVVIDCMYAPLQIFLMMRVYALFNRSEQIKFFLSLLWILESSFLVYSSTHGALELQFDPTCLVRQTPFITVVLSIVTTSVQTIIWSMIMWKRRMLGCRDNPLMRLLTRDSSIIFFVFGAVCAIFFTEMSHLQRAMHSVMSVYASTLSIMGCRAILNIQRLKIEDESHSVELTTVCMELSHSSFDDPESLGHALPLDSKLLPQLATIQ